MLPVDYRPIALSFCCWLCIVGHLSSYLATRNCMAASNQVDLTLQITHRMGLEPLRMDSLRYVNGDGELYSVDRLSYLLSGFVLESWEGHDVRMEGQFAWVDISSRRSLVHLHSIPKNRYKALRFSIGLTPKFNHARVHSLHPQDPLKEYSPSTMAEGRRRSIRPTLLHGGYFKSSKLRRLVVRVELRRTVCATALIL